MPNDESQNPFQMKYINIFVIITDFRMNILPYFGIYKGYKCLDLKVFMQVSRLTIARIIYY